MTPDRWRQISALFNKAVARPPAERSAVLAAGCGEDVTLRGEVEALLVDHDAGATFPSLTSVIAVSESATPDQPLPTGLRVGPYQIVALLGVGGMGVVYRATDMKLGRDVALKVLRPAVANDPDRMARFAREGRLLASLNHPHIEQVHGLEETSASTESAQTVTRALVMELVEGPTLADRIDAGALPVEEAVQIGRQIADALEAAHEQGIIHRDLKPANVKVRSDGTVKVLDFGLAKAANDDSTGGAVSKPTTDATRDGHIVGTPAYMSPEHARGKAVDKRTDIWAFGCVLYEMLTGRVAFAGETTVDTMAAILQSEPDWSRLPASTPHALRRLLERCLDRDVKRRLRDIGEARVILDEPRTCVNDAHAASLPRTSSPVATWRGLALVGGTVIVTIALFFVWTTDRRPIPARSDVVTRFEVVPPRTAPLLAGGGVVRIAVSPDGTRLAYPTDKGLAVRSLAGLDVRVVETRGLALNPFFSPDGRWIAYVNDGGLRKVSVDGGPSTFLAPVAPAATGIWSGASIVLADAHGLFRVSPEGGDPERVPLEALADTEQVAFPEALPGGSVLLIVVMTSRTNLLDGVVTAPGSRIEALDLRTGVRKVVVRGGSLPRYLPSGHLVYVAGDALMAVAFDAQRLEVRGEAARLADVGGISAISFTVSNEGTMAYVADSRLNGERTLVWVDRSGREEPLGSPPGRYAYARLSPDGSRVALDVIGPNRDIWLWDVKRKVIERFTLDQAEDATPFWSVDGSYLLFASARYGVPNIFKHAADRRGGAERLLESARLQQPGPPAPDGAILFSEAAPNRGRDIMRFSPATRRVEPVVATEANEGTWDVSPDGRWIAYTSDESGQFEVYVRPYPRTDAGQWKVSTSGGRQPLWSRNGKRLFYRDYGGAILAVSVPAGPRFSPGPQVTLLPANTRYRGHGAAVSGTTYSESIDGSRFLMIKTVETSSPPSLIVVTNWLEELRARVPVR